MNDTKNANTAQSSSGIENAQAKPQPMTQPQRFTIDTLDFSIMQSITVMCDYIGIAKSGPAFDAFKSDIVDAMNAAADAVEAE